MITLEEQLGVTTMAVDLGDGTRLWFISVAVELTLPALAMLRATFEAIPDDADVIVDLQGSSFVAGPAAELFLRLWRRRASSGHILRICNAPRSFAQRLEALGLHPLLHA